MQDGPGQIGRILILTGLAMAAAGTLVVLLGRVGFFRLPGDLQFGGRNWRIFVPVTTCILLSAVLTLVMWLINLLRR